MRTIGRAELGAASRAAPESERVAALIASRATPLASLSRFIIVLCIPTSCSSARQLLHLSRKARPLLADPMPSPGVISDGIALPCPSAQASPGSRDVGEVLDACRRKWRTVAQDPHQLSVPWEKNS